MSSDIIKEFFQQAMTDAALQEQLKAASSLPEGEAMEKIVEIARSAGYAFTVDDLTAFSKESAGQLKVIEDGNLTDEQMDAVAGGGCWSKAGPLCIFWYDMGHGDGCGFAFQCNQKVW